MRVLTLLTSDMGGSGGSGSGRGGGSRSQSRRGRPRSEAADRAILAAATEVLAAHGMKALSIEDVATRAGVGKATIYRRWSSKGTLALDAFLSAFADLHLNDLPDTGSLHGDLQASVAAWATAATTTSQGRMLVDLIVEAQRDPQLAAGWRDRVVRPIRARYTRMLERAKARGEIPEDADADAALDMLFGGGLYRLLNGHKPLNDEYVERAVSIVMNGLGLPSPRQANA